MRITVIVVGLATLVGCVADVTMSPTEAPPNADPQAGCAIDCHGADSSNAPPKSIAGSTATSSVAVGAHQQHLNVAPGWHRVVACADCHVVPAEVGSPGHIDGDNKAEVVFSALAGGTTAVWNGTSCTAKCHGSAAFGGTATSPIWTTVDGSQAACGSCHGAPPPAPHPAGTNCATCHPTMEENSLAFRDPSKHINGVVDVVMPGATGGCTTCHGSTNSAPPKDLAGNTVATARGVGAHQAHLQTSTWHNAVTCANCHVVPTTVDAPGHRDGDNIAEVIFDTLNPVGVYTSATTTCSTQYCHGNGQGGNGTISWVTPGARACGSCHSITGTGMSGQHRKHIVGEGMKCSGCHRDVIDANQTIINAALHIDGVHEVKMAAGTFNAATRACSNTGCHGTERW